VGAAWDILPPSGLLDPAASAALEGGFAALEAKQVAALAALQLELEAESVNLPNPEQARGGKKGKHGGKAKPSPEMIAHLQRQRRLERELKAEQQAQREAFVELLHNSVPHLSILDELVCNAGGKLLSKGSKGQAPATVWVEHGPVWSAN
jgi:hypothetical protein